MCRVPHEPEEYHSPALQAFLYVCGVRKGALATHPHLPNVPAAHIQRSTDPDSAKVSLLDHIVWLYQETGCVYSIYHL